MANLSITGSRTPPVLLDPARLLLRLTLGALILVHGISKIQGGPGFILDIVDKAGLPSPFGYLVYVGEVIAPILVIIGLWTRLAALVIAINMIVAVLLVHVPQLFTLADSGGWALELQGLYLVVAVCVALLGAGRYSLGGVYGRWN
ncbi:MAG TPA: DoxX family protein [Casimicrobiaceae bacterium]|nr:DoxX family protein [Casimicrobiaceae bacterium]